MKLSPFSVISSFALFSASTAALALSVNFTQVGDLEPTNFGDYLTTTINYKSAVVVANDGTVALTTSDN